MFARRPGLRKILSLILGSLSFIAILLFGVSWYINIKLRDEVSTVLKDLVHNSTNRLYKVEFSSIRIDFIFGNVTVKDLKVYSDQKRYQELQRDSLAPNNIYTLRLKELKIKKFHPWQLYTNKVLHINELIFNKPSVEMHNKHFSYNEDLPPSPRISPYQFISTYIKSLSIKTVKFDNVDFNYHDNNQPKTKVYKLKNLNIRCQDYLVDENSASDATRLYLFKEIHFSIRDLLYTTDDQFYNVGVDVLNFSSNRGRLELSGFKLLPRYKNVNFAKNAGYGRDRFEGAIDRIVLEGLNLPSYIKSREVHAKYMLIEHGRLNVYSDNNYVRMKRNSAGKFPHQLLQKLPNFLTVENTVIKNAAVKYSALDVESNETGEVKFSNIDGSIKNLTNHPKQIAENNIMSFNSQSLFMNEGKLKLNIDFLLGDELGAFSYKGVLGKFDGKKLNRITKAMGMLQITRGNVDELKFSVQANDEKAIGEMDFRYNGLSVKILKRDEQRDKLVRQGWASFIANNLILESENPSPGKALRSVSIRYNRDPNTSFFNYIWRTLFTGIKFSVGITPEREASLASHKETFSEIKEDMEARKVLREKRQEQRRLRKANK